MTILCPEVVDYSGDAKDSEQCQVDTKEKEWPVGIITHTIVSPPTMMIHHKHAPVTIFTMMNLKRLNCLTLLASRYIDLIKFLFVGRNIDCLSVYVYDM